MERNDRAGPGVLLWEFSEDLPFLEEQRRLSSGWQADNLRKNFSPSTVVDVGAAHGTPSLYAAFPDAHHILIDPLKEYEGSLRGWTKRGRFEYILVAVGDKEGDVTINVDPERLWGSSVLETVGWSGTERREIHMTTLDALLGAHHWSPPFGVKIDTEGFEHRVNEGATTFLKNTQFVIAEVSMSKRFEESYSFNEFIALMSERDFRPCDILDGLKNSATGEVVFVDMLFRRA
jgi:FkbM family methyltransferase